MTIKKKNDFFSNLLKKFLPIFAAAILIDFGISSKFTINQAKDEGVKTTRSPLNLSKKDHDAMTDTMGRLIKGVNEDLSKRINTLVNENIINRGSNKDLAKSLKELFDKENPNYFNYKNRFDAIARTESTRVLSQSGFNTAKRLGATGKYISIVDDNRTSDISKAMFAKYGSPDKAIPLDEEFSVVVRGKTFSGLTTPFHVSDRDIILYTYE